MSSCIRKWWQNIEYDLYVRHFFFSNRNIKIENFIFSSKCVMQFASRYIELVYLKVMHFDIFLKKRSYDLFVRDMKRRRKEFDLRGRMWLAMFN